MKQTQSGFTLLELLCALLLSTMLMVAVLGVVSSLAKTEKTLDRHRSIPAWQRRLVTKLEQDFRAAEEIEILTNGIKLRGLLASDNSSGNNLWQHASVDYLIEDSPLGKMLIRRETNSNFLREPRPEIMCQQIHLMAITLPGEIAAEQGWHDKASQDQPFITTLTKGPPPPLFQLTIRTAPNFEATNHRLTTL